MTTVVIYGIAFACLALVWATAFGGPNAARSRQLARARRASGRSGRPASAHDINAAAAFFRLGADGISKQVDIESFSDADLAAARRARKAGFTRASKRLFDLILAFALLFFLSPLLLVTAILIKLDSSGPVLYRQTRIGLDGRPFRIYKFRSMRQDAERNGAQWARSNDDRITRVGRIIRKTRIDEIPQAFNIIANEMSFVGPRPERPEFVATLRKEIPNYDERHIVKPGITGWAQINFEYGDSVEDARTKLTYDLFYVKNWGLSLDILIVLKTVRVALFGLGAR